jgi:hypothetical protein
MGRIAVMACFVACYRDAGPVTSEEASRELAASERERKLVAREQAVAARERALARFDATVAADDRAREADGVTTPAPAPSPPLPIGDSELVRCVSPHAGDLMFTLWLQWGRIYRLSQRLDKAPYSSVSDGPIDVTTYDPANRVLVATGTNGYGTNLRIDIRGEQVSIDVLSSAKHAYKPYTDHVCVFHRHATP